MVVEEEDTAVEAVGEDTVAVDTEVAQATIKQFYALKEMLFKLDIGKSQISLCCTGSSVQMRLDEQGSSHHHSPFTYTYNQSPGTQILPSSCRHSWRCREGDTSNFLQAGEFVFQRIHELHRTSVASIVHALPQPLQDFLVPSTNTNNLI